MEWKNLIEIKTSKSGLLKIGCKKSKLIEKLNILDIQEWLSCKYFDINLMKILQLKKKLDRWNEKRRQY